MLRIADEYFSKQFDRKLFLPIKPSTGEILDFVLTLILQNVNFYFIECVLIFQYPLRNIGKVNCHTLRIFFTAEWPIPD